MGCIQVDLEEEDPKRTEQNSIYVTTYCKICNEYSPSAPLSDDTKCWSFAKYLEMRFHSQAYKRRRIDDLEAQCTHSLNQEHVHNFSCNGIIARFTYTPIEAWKILLPSMIVTLPKEEVFNNSEGLQEDIKSLSQSGYEVYARIYDKLAQISGDVEIPLLTNLKSMVNNDQMMFKSRVEVVHTLLTDKNIATNEVNDSMLLVKRALTESVESWGPRLHEAATHMKNLTKIENQPVIDSGTICTEDLRSDEEQPAGSEDKPKDSKADTDEMFQDSSMKMNKKGLEEKKTVKSILNQFLSSTGNVTNVPSPIPANEHHNLPLGSFPVAVNDQDISSIVCQSLISNEYKKALENMSCSNNESSSSPSVKRKNQVCG